MKIFKILSCFVLFLSVGNTLSLSAQEGDQILDGIGETGLISRYVFDGHTKDWSRNNLHASVKGMHFAFVEDALFGKVISLEGKDAFLTIPAKSLKNEASISINGWVKLQPNTAGQSLFGFGKDASAHISMQAIDLSDETGLVAQIVSESLKRLKTKQAKVSVGKWVMFSLVLDDSLKSMTTYVNGVLVDEIKNVTLKFDQLFVSNSAQKNNLLIGKSIQGEQGYLNAQLHDFRIYRIPLNNVQVSNIYYKALKQNDKVVNEVKKENADLQIFADSEPQLYNQFLQSVAKVSVDTEVGVLPRLPRYVKATYTNGVKISKVRVLWPAPKNNAQVQKKGTYSLYGTISGSDVKVKAKVHVKDVKQKKGPKRALEVFNLDQVSLNADIHGDETKFIENRNKFISTLAKTNPNSFLYMFRNAFGQAQPKGSESLGVWDSQETKLRGHATGHYLTAIAQAYAGTGYDAQLQANFADKMNYMVDVLYDLSQLSGTPKEKDGPCVVDPTEVPPASFKQNYDSDLSVEGIRTDYWNWGKGFISAYPPDQFIMLEKGAKYGTDKTKIWAPYYTLHKILAGLMDVYEVSGNTKALEVAKGMGLWVRKRMLQLPTATLVKMWNTYIAGEFGGMNEVMARLYRVTNQKDFLEAARTFDNIDMFFGDANHTHGLAKNVDTFRGLHANQHIPQIVGALEMYRNSDVADYYNIADNFWYKATNDYMYSIGGVAGARNPNNAECFVKEPATLYENGLSSGGQNETCATYNMLKLTKNLFLFDQRTEFMDYYEQGLYNHVLASVAEDSPANTYHVPLRAGAIKHFGNPDMKGFTCCNGTALESSTKLQNAIYFRSKNNKELYVNLYVPSTLHWEEKNIIITQKTSFPKEDKTQLIVKGKGRFTINVRVPKWATNGFYVSINGKKQQLVAKPGTYLSLCRKWKKGDVIDLQMPFQFRLVPVMDQQNIASLFYGPILLAAQESAALKDWRKVTLDAKDIAKTIQGDPKKLEFMIDGVVFKPFYETYGHSSVYLNFTLK